jgi:hypothetical protein
MILSIEACDRETNQYLSWHFSTSSKFSVEDDLRGTYRIEVEGQEDADVTEKAINQELIGGTDNVDALNYYFEIE